MDVLEESTRYHDISSQNMLNKNYRPLSKLVTGADSADWSCPPCKEKEEEYLQQRRVCLAQKVERYNKATERKSQILDGVRNLDLPYSPLDDIIDELGGPNKVAEITGRHHWLIKASSGNGVR
ncbi:hypothetical protein POM88_012978 [Heracleum sosnowskyi]|uniref:Uncharacterized protein n=1 Tax=Heracleum sosnowskyi TaxID=360622 RepID=A0AAD8IXJ9_9APIA|nr:hypothetical protein POM88_012978 [Heracleum sosnowskyi]